MKSEEPNSSTPSETVASPKEVSTVTDSPQVQVVDLEELSRFQSTVSVQDKLRLDRSSTEKFFLYTAILSVSLSPIVVYVAIWLIPGQEKGITQIFEKWLSVLGPLLGAAFGFGLNKGVDERGQNQ